MSSSDEGPAHAVQGAKRRKLQRACDVCRRKKIRCDGVQMPGHQCTNCVDYGLDCTYVESAKKRGPPKSYVDSLETYVKNLQDLIEKISPEALRNLNNAPPPPLPPPRPVPTKNPSPDWSPASNDVGGPGRFLHLYASGSPSPTTDDDESMSFLMDEFGRMNVKLDEPRYFGKSSGLMLLKLAVQIKSLYTGVDPFVETSLDYSRRTYTTMEESWTYSPPKYRFPEPDLMKELVDLYFKHQNRYLPIFHRPTFERAISSDQHYSDQSFAPVLLMMCAVAAKYSNDPRVMDEPQEEGGKPDPHTSGWKWFGQISLIRPSPMSAPNIHNLQFYALVGQFLQASSVPHACWTVVGVAIRLALDIGVHRRKPKGVPHTVEDELWKRLFWVLVCMDRLFSSSTGRPCAIQDEDFDLDLPIECDDEYWEHPDPKLRWRQPNPEKNPSVIAYFNWYIRLNQILGFLLRTVYAINKSLILHGFVGQNWEERIVSELDSALNNWTATLPDHLRWDPTRPDELFFNQSASLFCFYQHIQILLHRPFIPSPQRPDKALSFPSLAICTSAARACSRALDVQRRRYGVAPPPLTTTAFSAGVVLLLSIWGGQKAGLNIDFDKEMVDVKRCMDVLALAEIKWYLAGRLSDILRELAHVGEMPLSQRASNSPPVVVSTKRERKVDTEDSNDDEYVPKSQPRTAARRKQRTPSEPRMKASQLAGPTLSLPQLPTLSTVDTDFRRRSSLQHQHQHQQSPLNPTQSQHWPRQNGSQKQQHDMYSSSLPPRREASHLLPPPPPTPPVLPTLPTFGQTFGSASFDRGPGHARTGPGVRPSYSYSAHASGDPAGVHVMNRGRSLDTQAQQGLWLDSSDAVRGNVGEPYTSSIWSNAPPVFESVFVAFRSMVLSAD
ncbi:hypothetical protein H0H93_016104 [Arthromyces matolae]|nr:hypothetical protein H0H93_016104 [Arthromyces matolae]